MKSLYESILKSTNTGLYGSNEYVKMLLDFKELFPEAKYIPTKHEDEYLAFGFGDSDMKINVLQFESSRKILSEFSNNHKKTELYIESRSMGDYSWFNITSTDNDHKLYAKIERDRGLTSRNEENDTVGKVVLYIYKKDDVKKVYDRLKVIGKK